LHPLQENPIDESHSKRIRRDIEPRAVAALRRMSNSLGRAKSFSFRGDCVMDEAIGPHAPGQTAQYSRKARIVVHRPDRLFGEGEDGGEIFSFWYRAPNLTVLERPANKTATVQVPGRIDAMLEEVAKKYGLTVPLADFLFSDPYKVLTEAVQSGRYVGQSDVDGIKCDHLLFTEEIIDWQIWVAAASPAVPRKFVIDYKSVPGRPQFTALLSDWNLSAAAGDDVFKPVIPADARKVELPKLLTRAEGGA
jgi:hypothetical protein